MDAGGKSVQIQAKNEKHTIVADHHYIIGDVASARRWLELFGTGFLVIVIIFQ